MTDKGLRTDLTSMKSEEFPKLNFKDGYRFESGGVIGVSETCSACLDYIPVEFNHVYTIFGGGNGNINRYGIFYNKNYGMVACFSQTKNDEKVSVNNQYNNAVFMRFTIYTKDKDGVYVYDENMKKYIIYEGQLMI